VKLPVDSRALMSAPSSTSTIAAFVFPLHKLDSVPRRRTGVGALVHQCRVKKRRPAVLVTQVDLGLPFVYQLLD
jgi:hypothetical protein